MTDQQAENNRSRAGSVSWHLEKSADHDVDGTWLVVVGGKQAGFVRSVWPRARFRRRYQGFVNRERVGRPCRTRREAAAGVVETYRQLDDEPGRSDPT